MLLTRPARDRPRLFLGFRINEELNNQCHTLPYKGVMVHWNPPGDRHITLRYLGENDADLVDRINEVLDAQIRKKQFHVHVQGLSILGKSPVLIAPVASRKNLVDLKRRIDERLAMLDIVHDQRDYYPHVTLARNKARDKGKKLSAYAQRHSRHIDTHFRLTHFSLFESGRPDHTGLRYTELARFMLGE